MLMMVNVKRADQHQDMGWRDDIIGSKDIFNRRDEAHATCAVAVLDCGSIPGDVGDDTHFFECAPKM